MSTQLSIRVPLGNPNHHLWNNNGTWWLHYTIHRPDYTKARVRHSLGTGLLREARCLRDRLLTAADPNLALTKNTDHPHTGTAWNKR